MENLGAAGPLRPPEEDVQKSAPSADTEAKPSADEKQLAKGIEKRFSDVQAGKDYFALLGVGRDCSTEEVKAAFLQLAKVFHPDRLPPTLHHLSPKITAVFEAIREGYETLQTDGKRVAYLKTLEQFDEPSRPTSGPEAKAEADKAFKRGEALFHKKDFAGAEKEYEHAHSLSAQGLYLAAAAWALYMDPARKSEASNAKQKLIQALKIDPNCDRIQFQLGLIARVEGEIQKAEKHFHRTLELNPKHVEAQQELRVIEMRKKKKGFGLKRK